MDDPVYLKTDKGKEEIQARKHGLLPQSRTALIMVDGRSSHRQLAVKLASVPDFDGVMRRLLEQGFIAIAAAGAAAPSPAFAAAAAPSAKKQALVSLATRLLGIHAARIVKKLQDTEDNAAALQAATATCCKLIKLTIDEELAKRFESEARKLA